MKVKIGFSPWTKYWRPEDIVGWDEDGKSIIREGAEPFVHSGWNCYWKFTKNGKQYGQWIMSSDWQKGHFPPSLRGNRFYKEAPRILYQAAKEAWEELEKAQKDLPINPFIH